MEFGLLEGCNLDLVSVQERLQFCFGGLDTTYVPLDEGEMVGAWRPSVGRTGRGRAMDARC